METKSSLIEKSHVPGNYLCELCAYQFPYTTGELACPKCGCHSSLSMVAIYVESDPQEEELHGKNYWVAGD